MLVIHADAGTELQTRIEVAHGLIIVEGVSQRSVTENQTAVVVGNLLGFFSEDVFL